MIKLKDTLLMPKTEFEMKGNLPSKEQNIQDSWEKNNIYEKVLKSNKNSRKYIFLDGPPYANGNIHIGHALNKILKDINVRFRNTSGLLCPYILGWDTHGLPIENALEKQGVSRKSLAREEFINSCEKYAISQINKQFYDFKRLGIFCSENEKYSTLDKDYSARQLEVFFNIYEKKLIYKSLKPVYWSWSSVSALAEAEVEYQDKNSNSIFIKFKSADKKDVNFIIWTTTPWTLPANKAIAINQTEQYSLIEYRNTKFWVAKNLVEKICKKLDFDNINIIKESKGSDLIGQEYINPITNEVSKVIHADHVLTSDGTGIVHIAPGHGHDDYIAGLKHNINVLNALDENGHMINSNNYNGLFYLKADKQIVEDMKNKDLLLKHEVIKHSYPHDWRTKKPVVYRATEQWFISIKPIKKEILSEIDKITTRPSWGKARIYKMIENREDWCISRQRLWGVPIPIFYDENKQPINNSEINKFITKKIKENGISFWYSANNEDLVPNKYRNKVKSWTKEKDIMDVWFDSGTAFKNIEHKYGKGNFKSEVYLEGSDQYRGWFNSSLINSVASHGESPYKSIISHGFVLDEKGMKMSKSKGNIIQPSEIINQYGADVLRLWVSSVNYSEDVRIGNHVIKQVSESYRKIRNTIRFMLGSINDLPTEIDISISDFDNEILKSFKRMYMNCIENYNNYEYEKVYTMILNFTINELSSFYLDIAKDVLYVSKKNDLRRRQIQKTIKCILIDYLILLSPILPHTTEEAYRYLNINNKKSSIFLERFINNYNDIEQNTWFNKFKILRSLINKSLEIARNNKIIGGSLEASVQLCLSSDYDDLLDKNLKNNLMVSKLTISKNISNPDVESEGIKIKIEKHSGVKCPRCWKYFDKDEMEADLCLKCSDVIKSLHG